MNEKRFGKLAAPPLTLLDFTTQEHNLGIEFSTDGNVIIDIDDPTQHMKLALTQDAVLEICKAQLTMLQGGSYE